MRKIVILSIIFASSFFVDLFAQAITVTARIDSTTMLIGNQTRLSFEISQQPKQLVKTPLFTDTIIGGLELVEPGKADTVTSSDGHLLVTQRYTVTSFEDSLLYIPPYPFVLNGDTVWSKSLSLKVIQPYKIDTTSSQVADIKPVLNPKFYWMAFFQVMLIVLAIVVILVLAIYLIRRLIQKKPVFSNGTPEPVLPPYELAVMRLNNIKQQKLWQQNRSKEYHTELTDVLREYIERTFDVSSLEMTSEEILLNLNHLRFESKPAYTALQQILKLADLVKFAKWNPAPDEHEQSLYNAYLFVNETKVEEILPSNEEVEEDLTK